MLPVGLGDLCHGLMRGLMRVRDSSAARVQSGFLVNPGGRSPSHM